MDFVNSFQEIDGIMRKVEKIHQMDKYVLSKSVNRNRWVIVQQGTIVLVKSLNDIQEYIGIVKYLTDRWMDLDCIIGPTGMAYDIC
jgi:hypothetical protein